MRRWEIVLTIVVGAVIAASVLRPALTDLDGNMPGTGSSENLCGAWVAYRGQEVLVEEGTLPVAFPGTAYADGGRVYPLSLLNLVLTLPLHPWVEAPGLHSLSLALNLFLAFVFAVVFLRYLGGSWWAALPGAVLLALSPYMLSHLIHGPAESTAFAWILPVFLAAERLGASERWRPGLAVLTGLLVAVSFAASPYSGVFACAAVAFSLLTRRIEVGPLWRRGAHGVVALVVAGVLIAPMAAAIRDTLDHPQTLIPGRTNRIAIGPHDHLLDERSVQDAVNFVAPTQRFQNEHYPERMYLGLVAMALVIVAMVRVREARRWGWLVLGGAVFCLGGTLRVAGWAPEIFGGPIRLPAGLICRLPLIDAVSHPYRFEPVVLMAMGAAIALFVGRCCPPGTTRRVAALLISAMILADLVRAYPSHPLAMTVVDVPVPEFYREIESDPGDYAVLDVPVVSSTPYVCVYYLYQLAHDKFVPYTFRDVNLGETSAAAAFAGALSMSPEFLFGTEANVGDGSADFACSDIPCEGAAELADLGYRYLVLHHLDIPDLDTALQDCVERCDLSPVSSDDQVRVYELSGTRSPRQP